ncbi:MAG TPA: thermonuclease family protein [Abditibacteriaceae bacterium]
MKRLLIALFFLTLLVTTCMANPCVAQTSAKASETEFSGKCVEVYSGDTIVVSRGEDEIVVRLYGIDAAESSRPHAQQSLDFLKQRVLNKTVKVYLTAISKGEFDASGWVFVGQECMNVASVEAGHSWWDRNNAPNEKKLQDLESRARESKKGLWVAAYPMPPWEMDRFWVGPGGIEELFIKHIKDVPLLEAETDQEGRPVFSQVTLKLFADSGDGWYGALRFKVPREARSFVWAFLPPANFKSWSIRARSGGVSTFRNYMPRDRNSFPALRNLAPTDARELYLQTLDAYSLVPGQEYFLYFRFDENKPATFQVMHTFADINPRTSNAQEVASVLGLEFNEKRDLVIADDGDPLIKLNTYVHVWHLSPTPTEWPERGRFLAISSARRQQLTEELKKQSLQYFFTPFIDLSAHYGNSTEYRDCLTFAYRTLRSEKARKVTILTGSDDTMRVWINGELVVNKPELRAAVPDTDRTSAKLIAGDNEVLVEVSTGDGGWGFFFRLLDEAGQDLIAAPDGSLASRASFYDPLRFVRSWRFSATPEQWMSKLYFNTVTPTRVQTLMSELIASSAKTYDLPFIDLRAHYSPGGSTDLKTAYALSTVISNKEQPAVLLTGSDDAIRVWLNGKLVVKQLALRTAQADEDRTPVMLRQGPNSILVEVSSGDGGWGFFLALNDDQGSNFLIDPDGSLSPRKTS